MKIRDLIQLRKEANQEQPLREKQKQNPTRQAWVQFWNSLAEIETVQSLLNIKFKKADFLKVSDGAPMCRFCAGIPIPRVLGAHVTIGCTRCHIYCNLSDIPIQFFPSILGYRYIDFNYSGKLMEEVKEYIESPTLDESTDMIRVAWIISCSKGIDPQLNRNWLLFKPLLRILVYAQLQTFGFQYPCAMSFKHAYPLLKQIQVHDDGNLKLCLELIDKYWAHWYQEIRIKRIISSKHKE